MALTKSRTSLNSGTTMTAGAGNVTGSTVDITGAYETILDIKLTNGATGPTVPAQVQVQIAADAGGTLFVDYGGPFIGSTANSAVSSWSIVLPLSAGAFRLVTGSNTGQNVTLDSDYSRVTAL